MAGLIGTSDLASGRFGAHRSGFDSGWAAPAFSGTTGPAADRRGNLPAHGGGPWAETPRRVGEARSQGDPAFGTKQSQGHRTTVSSWKVQILTKRGPRYVPSGR